MKGFLSMLLTTAALLSACGKPEPTAPVRVPMEMDAPTLKDSKPLAAWIVGEWDLAVVDDLSHLGMPGMKALVEDTKKNLEREPWTFRADGTFSLRRGKQAIAGSYAPTENGVSLTYVTLNGKPLAEEIAKAAKAAEAGRQADLYQDLAMDELAKSLEKRTELRLTVDRRKLQFVESGPTGEPTPSPLGLERMKVQAAAQ